MSENLFLALVVRDQHCRWPGCTVRATWCDAHHVTEWGHHGRTNEWTCALLCHYHHSLTHQPGWSVTGNGHEFTIHHPDGSCETSRPPTVRSAGTACESPPGVATPRAESIGREPVPSHVHDSEATGQLEFA